MHLKYLIIFSNTVKYVNFLVVNHEVCKPHYPFSLSLFFWLQALYCTTTSRYIRRHVTMGWKREGENINSTMQCNNVLRYSFMKAALWFWL